MWKDCLAKSSDKLNLEQRELWLDIAKFFCIVLVVLNHMEIKIPVVTFFGGMFYMPLFFVAAGYTFRRKEESFLQFALGKAKRLLVPYFVCNVLLVGLFTVLNRSISKPALLGIFYSRSMLMAADSTWNMALMPHLNAPTWFLTCLFLCLCMYWMIDIRFADVKKRRIAVGICVLLGILMRTISPVLLPWSIENALYFLGLMELGRFLKEGGHAWLRKNEWIYANFLMAFAALSYLNGAVNVSISVYGKSMLLYLFTGALGSVLCMKAAELTEKYLKFLAKPFAFVGRHTLPILCWHLLVIEVVRKVIVLL